MSTTSKHGYVMMLDVLGFREYVSKRGDIDFFNIWDEINKSIDDKKNELLKRFKDQINIDYLCLSDTLIICVSLATNDPKIDDRAAIVIFIELIGAFFNKQMQENSIFFRGAISYGQYYFNDKQNIIMGPALDEASEWYETVDWIGIILSPSAEYAVEMYLSRSDVDNIKRDLVKKTFCKYPRIPFKPNIPKICHYAFCWIDPSRDEKTRKDNWTLILDIFSKLKHSITYASKYSNALDFIHYILFDEHEKDKQS